MDIKFLENSAVDPQALNDLYYLIGWDKSRRRSVPETEAMLNTSAFHVQATSNGRLVGFARVCGDPYVAQVLDVITHPDYRRRGIATACMRRVVVHLAQANYVSVTLNDDSGIPDFYQKFGFEPINEFPMKWQRQKAK